LEDLNQQIKTLADSLKAEGGTERAHHEKRYLKSTLEHWGAPVPKIRRHAKRFAKQLPPGRDAVWRFVDRLWAEGVHELRMAAVEVLRARVGDLDADDIPRILDLVREARGWVMVDPLAIEVLGPIFDGGLAAPELLDTLAADEDFWIRRASMLTMLRPLREGRGELERFLRLADRMLEEKEFFIRKAIGWLLREVGKKRPEAVLSFLAPRTHRASGVTMREAVKPLSEDDRALLMDAYKRRVPAHDPARGSGNG